MLMGYVIAIIISRNILIRKKNAGDDTQKSGEFCVKNKKQGQSCAFLRKGCPFGVYGGRVFRANTSTAIAHTASVFCWRSSILHLESIENPLSAQFCGFLPTFD